MIHLVRRETRKTPLGDHFTPPDCVQIPNKLCAAFVVLRAYKIGGLNLSQGCGSNDRFPLTSQADSAACNRAFRNAGEMACCMDSRLSAFTFIEKPFSDLDESYSRCGKDLRN